MFSQAHRRQLLPLRSFLHHRSRFGFGAYMGLVDCTGAYSFFQTTLFDSIENFYLTYYSCQCKNAISYYGEYHTILSHQSGPVQIPLVSYHLLLPVVATTKQGREEDACQLRSDVTNGLVPIGSVMCRCSFYREKLWPVLSV
jgi:hypothetical protein